MKTRTVILFFALATMLISCKMEKSDSKNGNMSALTLKASAEVYSGIISKPPSQISDPFDLDGININGEKVEITVSYSGGCSRHAFEVIWDEAVSDSNPPSINLVITHNANGDNCKAYITETLSFNLSDLIIDAAAGKVTIDAFSGYNPGDSAVCTGDSLDFRFVESDICNIEVKATAVICGWGLYNNVWFALKDSVSAGIDNFYYKKYLQPVSVDENLTGFIPVPGTKYTIGARIDKSTGNLTAEPVCLAYPGLSVPVKIMCITELK